MREKAVAFYKKGYNCSQCILKAIEAKYKVTISKQCYDMCAGISNGFGIGSDCSVLNAGVMMFGLLYDDETAKRLRIRLLSNFQEKYGSMRCDSLKKQRHKGERCEALIADIADMIDNIIQDEGI